MSAKRIRRFTLSVDGNPVAGVRNWEFDPAVEVNTDRSDDEASGTPVEMSNQPGGTFETQSPEIATGYFQTAVVSYKVVEIATGAESIVTKTQTFTTGHITRSLSVPTEGAGKCGMKLVAKTMVEA